MHDSSVPPLSLKDRIAQLQQAAASPLTSPSPSSSTLGPTSSSSTAPSPPQRAPSPQVLARYIQPSTNTTPFKADPAHTSTSALTARGERPTSPTTSRSSPAAQQQRTRPSFVQPHSRAPAPSDPPLRDAEAALSAHLAASPARSRAGSTASLADPQPKPRPPPPPRPAFAAAKHTTPVSDAAQPAPPPLPTRSSTLSSSSSASPAPAPLLPPRRASTLSVHPPTASAGGLAGASAPSPPLPPRPRAATAAGAAAGPQRAVPPRPQGFSGDGPSRGPTTAAARPALVPKPTTHDPLSVAAGPAARAKPYAASSRLGSSSAATASRTSLVSTASSASSSPGMASPAWLVPNKPATPLSALPERPVDARARRRYEDVFARLVERDADEDEVEGQVVAGVWRRSGLPEGELRRIWEEVASGETALDGEAFVKGMWAIDEALRVRRERSGVRV
ncbi:hypothetical protein JCM3775_007549 [Rhodotorula graminis]